jgi:hypothetical protein
MWDVGIENKEGPDYKMNLFGKGWLDVIKDKPELNERGKKLAHWIRFGAQVTVGEARGWALDAKNILSSKPHYLIKRLKRTNEYLSIMAEVIEMNEMAREEIHAQEHYRSSLRAGLGRLISTMRGNAQDAVSRLTIPRTPREQYMHGYNRGKYEVWAQCMQYIQEVVDQAALDLTRMERVEKAEDKCK